MALYPCPECQKQISEKARSCPSCGAVFAGICPECHTFRDPSATSCGNCGHPFSAAKLLGDKAAGILDKAAGAAASGGGIYGKVWFSIWTYLLLPVGVLLNLVFAFVSFGDHDPDWQMLGLIPLVIALIQVAVVVGLAKRSASAWAWNWLLIYNVCLGFFVPLLEEDAPPAVIWIPIALVLSIAWLIPNHIYWRKRREWFG